MSTDQEHVDPSKTARDHESELEPEQNPTPLNAVQDAIARTRPAPD